MSMTWDFILRLFVAGALGTVIGLDREYRAKEAGYGILKRYIAVI